LKRFVEWNLKTWSVGKMKKYLVFSIAAAQSFLVAQGRKQSSLLSIASRYPLTVFSKTKKPQLQLTNTLNTNLLNTFFYAYYGT